MKDTLKSRILSFVRANPGKSATEIANALEAKKDSVASTLCVFTETGILRREGDKGPRGGYIYFEAESKITRRTRFERVID